MKQRLYSLPYLIVITRMLFIDWHGRNAAGAIGTITSAMTIPQQLYQIN